MSGGKIPVIGTEGDLKKYLKKRIDEATETGTKPAPVTLPVRGPAGIVTGLTIRIGPSNVASYSFKYGLLEVKPNPDHPGHVLRRTATHRVNLGSHPALTLEDARMKASEQRNKAHDARRGKADAPHVEVAKSKAAVQVASGITVQAIGERYIRDHCIGDDPEKPRRRSHR